MKRPFFVLILGIKCFECFTHVSWEDCRDKMVVKECELGDDRCIQGEMTFMANNVTDRILFKTCASEYECKIYPMDAARIPSCADRQRRGFSIDCGVKCCDDDSCNIGIHGQVASVFLLLTCVPTVRLFVWAQSNRVWFMVSQVRVRLYQDWAGISFWTNCRYICILGRVSLSL